MQSSRTLVLCTEENSAEKALMKLQRQVLPKQIPVQQGQAQGACT